MSEYMAVVVAAQYVIDGSNNKIIKGLEDTHYWFRTFSANSPEEAKNAALDFSKAKANDNLLVDSLKIQKYELTLECLLEIKQIEPKGQTLPHDQHFVKIGIRRAHKENMADLIDIDPLDFIKTDS
jgi:hypothetical protein